MRLRKIDFGNILGASGVQGFFGEGYRFHKPWKSFGLDFNGMTFVSKTATLQERAGNMPLNQDYTPIDLFPDCVRAKPFKAVMLNSVGLSNPGLGKLLDTGKWQRREKPFFISIMSLGDTPEKRLGEFKAMVEMIGLAKNEFSAPFGLQINLSCPNTGHDPSELIGESAEVIEIANSLGVPVMPKYSIASAPIEAIMELQNHNGCDAICVSNTLPYGWEYVGEIVWGEKESPLKKLGGGGVSGRILLPYVCDWISRLRKAGFTKPINGGGGILHAEDVNSYRKSGASSVFLGSVAALRPWRVKGIINEANGLRWEE